MDKIKKIIISLSISLLVLIIVNCIVVNYTNSNYIKVPVFNKSILKGRQINVQDVTYIQVKNVKENKDLLQNVITENFTGILTQDVIKGEIVTLQNIISKDEALESDTNYKYISVPISNLSYPTCSKLKRGEIVTIYYTAKNKAVANAIKDKQRLYSNAESEGLVTCLLFDSVEVISTHDSTGKETKDNVITDILVRLSKEDAILVANLKSQGTFDIVLN